MPEKILIVDDDVDTLRLVGIMLQRQGYQIVAASNGNQAIQMAQSEDPDLILLDVMMPDLDGYEVTKRLRGDPGTGSIPIIMFTAKSQVDDKVTGFEVGADDYLTKPTQPRELFAHVKAVLARGGKKRAPSAAVSGEKGHVVGILAAKGGLGVSTLATNLAITMRVRTRKDVILGELRPGEGSIALDLGYPRPEGLNRLLQKKSTELSVSEVEKELITHTTGTRMLLASFLPSDARNIYSVDAYEIISRYLSYLANFVILDLGPGLSTSTEKILNLCDDIIIVLEPLPHTLTRTKALLDDLMQRGFGEGRVNIVLINRVRTEMQLSWTQVKDKLGHELAVAFTPAPELTYQSSNNNVPVVIQQPDSLTSQQFSKLAEVIVRRTPVKT